MLRISDIMTRDVIAVSPDLALRDAMELFAEEHISGAPVLVEHKLVGVVSATDLLRLAASLPGSPTLREPTSEPDVWQPPEDFEAGGEPPAEFFTELWEDAGEDVGQRMAEPESPEWNVLSEHTVAEAMSSRICRLTPETDVPHAAEYMQKNGVHRALVMQGERLVGIVSTSDVAKAVADHKISERRFVFGKPQVREGGAWW